MWLELLQERVKWWNLMVVELNKDIKTKDDIISIEYVVDNQKIQDIDTNIIFVDKRRDFFIRLTTPKEFFHQVSLSLLSTGNAVGFEMVAESMIRDCIVAGFNNNIAAIRHLHLSYPDKL